MKLTGLAASMGVAAGIVTSMMLPKDCTARKAAQKAADAVEDAAQSAKQMLDDKLDTM